MGSKVIHLKRWTAALAGVVLASAPLLALAQTMDVRQDPVVRAVQKVLPTVVNISTARVVTRQARDPFEELFSQFFGRRPAPSPEQAAFSLGSGVIVDASGFIVTNEHVVQRASKISVKLAEGTEYEATYLAGDAKNDLALLKIEPKKPLQAIELEVEDELLLGEPLIALGNPFGLEQTVTRGVLSAKNRKASWEGKVVFDDILQTDAAINPGNSGGPLVDINGRLVGVNVAILADAHGIGFAIPAKRVATMLTEWFSLEKSKRVWLGAKWEQSGAQVVVAEVQADSPSARGGLRAGDAVARVDGAAVDSILAVERKLLQKNAGDSVEFALKRGNAAATVTVKLAALPKPNGFELAKRKLGVTLGEITKEVGERLMLTVGRGMLIREVVQEVEAWKAGLREGMVVLAVNDRETNSLDQVGEILDEAQAGEKVKVFVFAQSRQGGTVVQQTAVVALTAK